MNDSRKPSDADMKAAHMHCHRRAEETRKIAERQQTDAGRRSMLRIANLYDEFASRPAVPMPKTEKPE
jgi:hypothetical protein